MDILKLEVGKTVRVSCKGKHGEKLWMVITPTSGPYWGVSQWHPKPGWLINVVDCTKDEARVLALSDMGPAP